VEDDAGLAGLGEVQPAADRDVEQVVEREPAQQLRFQVVGGHEVLGPAGRGGERA
jgi:hypothetical protein